MAMRNATLLAPICRLDPETWAILICQRSKTSQQSACPTKICMHSGFRVLEAAVLMDRPRCRQAMARKFWEEMKKIQIVNAEVNREPVTTWICLIIMEEACSIYEQVKVLMLFLHAGSSCLYLQNAMEI